MWVANFTEKEKKPCRFATARGNRSGFKREIGFISIKTTKFFGWFPARISASGGTMVTTRNTSISSTNIWTFSCWRRSSRKQMGSKSKGSFQIFPKGFVTNSSTLNRSFLTEFPRYAERPLAGFFYAQLSTRDDCS